MSPSHQSPLPTIVKGPATGGFRRTIGAVLLLLCPALFAAGNDWMTDINGTKPLSRITIPGTHNSGARHETFGGTAKCQDHSISDQLGYGVRFLDIRCRHLNDAFEIYHGSVSQQISFGTVLDEVYAFLKSNPGECILMSIKPEHSASGNTRNFEATFDSHVAANPAKWSLGTSVPALKDVRGKIVLIRRFGSSASKGIDATNWPNNSTFSANHLSIQDNYVVGDNATKWRQLKSALAAANAETDATVLHLNFGSGYKPGLLGIPNIPVVSDHINPLISGHFETVPPGHHGCVIMDFANAARCQRIYNTNSAKKRQSPSLRAKDGP